MVSSEESILNLIRKNINLLSHENKFVRKSSLMEIEKSLQPQNLRVCDFDDLVCDIYKPILKCFQDPAEVCREKSICLLENLLEQASVNESYLVSIVPTLYSRLGEEKTMEQSEEVRLLLMNFLKMIISKYNKLIALYLNDLIDILKRTIIDPYPEVKITSCLCAADLALISPHQFYSLSESLIPPLIQTIKHHQSKVRITAINTIGSVVDKGNNRSVEDVFNPLAERLFDQSPGVRKAVAVVAGNWLLTLRDRYSYFKYLLPILLTSLSDEISELRMEAALLWEKVGLQYLQENEKDLREKLDYLPSNLDHYPPGLQRPNLGCRVLVQRELSKFIPAIAKELEDWVDSVKVKAAQLLVVVLLNGESSITMHLEKILPTMYRAIIDPDKRVSENVERAAKMMGYFVPPNVYCKLVLPLLEEKHHAGHLNLLAALISGTEKNLMLPHLEEIVNILSSENVCHSKEASYQFYLLEVCYSIFTVCEQHCSTVSQQFFIILVSVIGLSMNENVSVKAKELLESLSSLCLLKSVAELFEQHSDYLLSSLKASCETLSVQSPQRFIFEAFLKNAGPVIGIYFDATLSLVRIAVEENNDPESVLAVLIILSQILVNWKETLSRVENVPESIEKLIDILKVQLIWRAGLSAETLRTAAVSCVLSALSVRPFSPILPSQVTPILINLIEDQAHKTRLFALSSLCKVIEMERESNKLSAKTINKLYPEIMKRFDDVNDEVRARAVKCISILFQSPLPADYDISASHSHFEFIYQTLLIHLDDPNLEFQGIVMDVLKNVSTFAPDVLKQKLSSQKFRNTNLMADIRKFIDFQSPSNDVKEKF